MNKQETINLSLKANQEIANALLSKSDDISTVADKFRSCLRAGGKLIFFGNGGSAADSMHIAAEYASKGLSAISLSENIAAVMAIGNDTSYNEVFTLQLKALARDNDLAVALSASGESKNIIAALEYCKQNGIATIGFTGDQKNSLSKLAGVCFEAPSGDVGRIQETYLLVNHIIYQLVRETI